MFEAPGMSATEKAGSAFYSFLDVEEVVAKLQTNLQHGLRATDAISRRLIYGRNELETSEKETILSKIIDQFKNPMILLLIGSALVSLFLGHFDDALSIALAISIVSTVAFVQEYRSEKSLEALNKLVPYTCHCSRDGHISLVSASDLVPGDVIHFSVGDRIPADLRITRCVDLGIDESMLTGENKPNRKTSAQIPRSLDGTLPLTDRKNIAFMGTLVVAGNGTGVVVGIAEKTEFGQVFLMMKDIEEKKTPLQLKMDELGKQLSFLSFIIIGMIFIIGVIQGKNWLQMFTIGVSLAVAAIPEGLPIVVTVTLALGVMRMARRKAIVKKLPAVESLGSVNVICVDKTGTLTRNQMTVTQVYTMGSEEVLSVLGNKKQFKSEIDVEAPEINMLLRIGCLCNNAFTNEQDEVVGQPTEVALLNLARHFKFQDHRKQYERKVEIPFSSESKWMAVQCSTIGQNELLYYTKGAPEAIVPKCFAYMVTPQESRTMSEASRETIFAAVSKMACEGLRVLALAYGKDPGSLVFVGLVGMIDPLRQGVEESVHMLLRADVKVVMITGDSQETATTIGRNLGLLKDPVQPHELMAGSHFQSLSEAEQRGIISGIKIFYRAIPKHKVSIVKSFQSLNAIVAMTGDGVNDAPALKMANIGVAMGLQGTDVSKEAADMILVDDNFSTILSAIEEGKSIYFNIKNFVRFQLSTSIAALTLIIISTSLGLPNPLNAMQILWINIIMDGPPAQSLGVEPVDHDVMKRPPRDQNAPFIDRGLVTRVITSAILIVAGTLFVFTLGMVDGVVTPRDTTMTFTTFVMFDMFNALACRSADKSIFQIGLFTNKAFVYSVGTTILVQLGVIYVPFLQAILQTQSLHLSDLLMIVAISSSVFWVDEVRKFLLRTRREGSLVRNVNAFV